MLKMGTLGMKKHTDARAAPMKVSLDMMVWVLLNEISMESFDYH